MLSGALRHQLASTSPIRWRGLGRALRAAAGGADPRPALSELLRREHAAAGVVLCGSGTQALTFALQAAERLQGGRRAVALPAFTCFDVAAAAVRNGRPVRFYDIDPATLGPDLPSLAAAVDAGAGVAVVASLYGLPVDWDAVDPVLGEHAVVVEDAAQGHGGRWRGAPLGGHGRLGVLSFARGKGWTGGAGGAVLVRAAGDVAAVSETPLAPDSGSELKVLVRAGAHRALGHPSIYRLPRSLPGLGLGETRFHPAVPPAGLPASAAALLLDSRSAAEAEASRRRAHAAEYRAELARRGIATPTVAAAGEAGYVRFPVLVRGGMSGFRDPQRAAALGAAPSYPIALPRLPELAQLIEPASTGAWPGAERLAAELVTLPTHGLVRPEERRELLELLAG